MMIYAPNVCFSIIYTVHATPYGILWQNIYYSLRYETVFAFAQCLGAAGMTGPSDRFHFPLRFCVDQIRESTVTGPMKFRYTSLQV